ncbi:glycosyl hydrolase catalytic core-domain-containing protein [Coniochaeta sp. 2T2.1]|nr:glycosyl hydrolase catalytic core-domain-containing protein [Coniochaeta sp. 2T2.1]
MAPPSRLSWLSSAVSLLATCANISPVAATSSSKRGLCFTPNATTSQDNYIWTRKPSDLTWYYNYGASPSPVYGNLTQDDFEFVPMLWGAPEDSNDVTFINTVKGLINNGRNITHVMAFNEPDGPTSWGGSDVDPTKAAEVWITNIQPLRDMGLKVGLPACTGGWGGIPWTNQFLGNCSKLISAATNGKTKNCTYDFIPLHWYGPFDALASHIGNWQNSFNATKIWVTEYNFDNQDLPTTQAFYNMSSEYMDRLEVVERYSIFAAFRSDASNVGPNATMLSAGGELTDIGAWYLGRDATGVAPTDTKKASGAVSLTPGGWSTFALMSAAAFAVASLLL